MVGKALLERYETRSVALATLVALGTCFLFYIDVTSPRGVLDGVGYPAVVALCIQFGRRTVYFYSGLATVLIAAAAFLLPNAGISVQGEIANRGFALASVWIIAFLMVSRISAEETVSTLNETFEIRQRLFVRLLRNVVVRPGSFDTNIRHITESSAELLDADFVGVHRLLEGRNILHTLDLWHRKAAEHRLFRDLSNQDPRSLTRQRLEKEFVMVSEDVANDPTITYRREILDDLGVKSLLVAGIFSEGVLCGYLTFGQRHKRQWTAHDRNAARSLAVLTALVFAGERYNHAVTAFDLVTEGLILEDDTGYPIYANRAAFELATAPDSPRPTLAELRVTKLPGRLNRTRDQALVRFYGRELEIERARLSDGGIIARVNDATARIAGERERERLQARLQQAAKMEAVGQLAGGVAHDFNNILGSIMGFAGFLVDDLPTESAERRFAQRIFSAGQRGKELVEQILAFARTYNVERTAVRILPVLQRSEELVRSALPPGVRFDCRLADENLEVLGHETQISQLLVNLCRNAADAVGERGGTVALAISAADPQEIDSLASFRSGVGEILTGDVDGAQDYVCIRVSDDGSGIPFSVLERIFEPFFTTKGRDRGTGLGLAVVHGTVQSHHGFCHVKTVSGAGTAFSVYLPRIFRRPHADSATGNSVKQTCGGHERVLVVDDQVDIVDTVTIGLERLGYDCVGLTDPLEALAAFEEDPAAFDVIVTDQVMPGMRGTDLLQRMKRVRANLKSVICSGYDSAIEKNYAPADAFLQKPVDASTIAARIRTLLDG